jgi:hypothetical protein
MFLHIKVRMLLLGDPHQLHPSRFYLHFHNDLPCYLCSRSHPYSGYLCPSPAWRLFYRSYVVNGPFVLDDPKSVFIAVQQQCLPVLLYSYAVSSCG